MVFYQCFGRAHTSVVAAAIHLGLLPAEGGVPSTAQIMALPYFDRAEKKDFGRPLFLGRDEEGHEIFILGLGGGFREGLGAIASVFRLAGREGPLIVDTLLGLGILGRLGGGLSRELGLVRLGRPLAAYGVKKIYPRLVRTVTEVKSFLRTI
ncbi:MAG: DUF3189 family protein [Bacillota bacterium]